MAGVEVSTDGGTTWHPATGTTSWSYTFVQHGRGSGPVQVRAIDDSANIGAAGTRVVRVTCPCSLFGADGAGHARPPPTTTAGRAGRAVHAAPSTASSPGVRFYKGTGNTGTHVGSLWSPERAAARPGTFTDETATGWQTATFTSPVAVTAGQTYIVSYTAPVGHYAAQPWAFAYRGRGRHAAPGRGRLRRRPGRGLRRRRARCPR